MKYIDKTKYKKLKIFKYRKCGICKRKVDKDFNIQVKIYGNKIKFYHYDCCKLPEFSYPQFNT